MTTWVLLDFAGVIGLHQPKEDQEALLAAAGSPDADSFWQAYWGRREDFDAGRSDADHYWSTVLHDCGGVPTPERIHRLVELDVASWLHPDQGTVELLNDLGDRGVKMALLSNCPRVLASALETLPWLGKLSQKFYSSHLSLIKPSAEIYSVVAHRIGAEPSDVIFVDDRPPNVHGAEEAGMRGLVFTNASLLREDLYRSIPLA